MGRRSPRNKSAFRRWLLAPAVFGVAGIAGWAYWAYLPPPSLTVASWGGEYTAAQNAALFHPFTDQSGVAVSLRLYGGGTGDIARQVSNREIEWDVVDFELEDAARACRDGLLERLDELNLPPGADGSQAADDFVPGAIGPCWVGTAVYSQVIAFSKEKASPEEPRSLADFFDVKRFPGPRALRGSGPKFNLELALMADGVAPGEVYPTLATEAGVTRAFAKLDTIKPQIIWWQRAAEPPELLAQGKAAMATVLNARIFDTSDSLRLGAIFDGQLYQMDVFGVPKGTEKKSRAFEFLRYATGTEALAEEARLLPYAPARRSSLATIDPERRARLPTAPENFARALFVDPDWWAEHGASLEKRWTEWREK